MNRNLESLVNKNIKPLLKEWAFSSILEEDYMGVDVAGEDVSYQLESKCYFFRKVENGFSKVLYIQTSKYGESFTFETGIFIPKAYCFSSDQIPTEPHITDCVLRHRVGELKGDYDNWYEIDSKTDFNELEQQIKTDINQVILPWFSSFSNEKNIIPYLLKSGEFEKITAALLLIKLGDKKKGEDLFNEVYKTAKAEAWKNVYKETALKNNIPIH